MLDGSQHRNATAILVCRILSAGVNPEDHRSLVQLDEHFEPCFSSFSTWNCEISASGEAFSLPEVSIVKAIQEWYFVEGGRWCSISVLFGDVGRIVGGQAYQEGLSQYTKLEIDLLNLLN